MNNDIPEIVSEAFPVLARAVFARQLASPVPLSPDTTFDIYYIKESDGFMALVTTDYPDPMGQSLELKRISGQYEFEFSNLIMPHDNDKTTPVLENDDMDGYFLVSVPYKKYYLYYYVANLSFKD